MIKRIQNTISKHKQMSQIFTDSTKKKIVNIEELQNSMAQIRVPVRDKPR